MADINFVLFDCDVGTDDAWALLMLIKAETVLNLIKILAITTVVGNTKVGNATENTLRVLNSVNRTDIPVYKGCSQPYLPIDAPDSYFYGKDGFGDVFPSVPSALDSIPDEHAVNIMYELASKHPKQISFIMAGPLTNLAACINMHDDFLDKVKDIWMFGGDLYDYRNSSTHPEFNFNADRAAANVVLRNAKVPVYIVPKEPCRAVNEEIDLAFRFDYIGSVDSPAINLLNTVEKAIFLPKGNWHLYDPYLSAAFIFKQKVVVNNQTYHGRVDICGENTGALVLDDSAYGNVHMIEEFDADEYKKILAWAGGVPGVEVDNL